MNICKVILRVPLSQRNTIPESVRLISGIELLGTVQSIAKQKLCN